MTKTLPCEILEGCIIGVIGEFEFAGVERIFDGDGVGPPTGDGVQYWKNNMKSTRRRSSESGL